MKKSYPLLILFYVFLSYQKKGENPLSKYDVIWDSPSEDSRGLIPIGNGDIGGNMWVEPNGDICMFLSKTDAWNENIRLLKLGKLRLVTNPNPVKQSAAFRQQLNLETGAIGIDSPIT